jgi:hypothetical protein
VTEDTLNPYQAPATVVADVSAVGLIEPTYFPVGLVKLAVMSVVTLGVYKLYWFYQNWKAARRLDGDNPWPVPRALFYPIMSYSLFRRIDRYASRSGVPGRMAALGLALALFVLELAYRLPDPYWLLALLSFVPLLPVQATVNAINAKVAPHAEANRRFTAWNVVGIVVGIAFLALIFIGLFVTVPPAPNV